MKPFFVFLVLYITLCLYACDNSSYDSKYIISIDKKDTSCFKSDTLVLNIKDYRNNIKYKWENNNPDIADLIDNYKSVIIIGKKVGKDTIRLSGTDGDNLFNTKCIVSVLQDTIKILAIGNSFSENAIEQNLYELAENCKIPLIIGNMYIGGCSLETHLTNAINNYPNYEYRKIVNGKKYKYNATSLFYAIKDENWNYISFQQVSYLAGTYKSYVKSLPQLVEYIKKNATNPKLKLVLHQTWAYAKNATLPYYINQKTMYDSIVSAVNKASILTDINIIVPTGTAIQNARTSFIGDKFNSDGVHLEGTYGKYTAACTWFEKILGINVIGNKYSPNLDEKVKQIVQKAAHFAIQEPSKITDLSYQ